jgi:hypothetical protein
MGGMVDSAKVTDFLEQVAGYRREHADDAGIRGFGWAELRGPDNELKLFVPFTNLITNWGDQYLAIRNAPIMTALTVTITATTAADPVVCTTSAAHGVGLGDMVTLSASSQAVLNGTWKVTAVSDTTHFAIDVGAVGPATATATLTAIASAAAQCYPVVNVMKLGTGAWVAPNKTTPTGQDLFTYTAGQSGATCTKAFDATYPQFSNLGNGLGDYTVYKTTWAAGDATTNGLTEIALCAEHPSTDTALTSGATKGIVAHAQLSPTVNKGALDTLAVTWNLKFLGS